MPFGSVCIESFELAFGDWPEALILTVHAVIECCNSSVMIKLSELLEPAFLCVGRLLPGKDIGRTQGVSSMYKVYLRSKLGHKKSRKF